MLYFQAKSSGNSGSADAPKGVFDSRVSQKAWDALKPDDVVVCLTDDDFRVGGLSTLERVRGARSRMPGDVVYPLKTSGLDAVYARTASRQIPDTQATPLSGLLIASRARTRAGLGKQRCVVALVFGDEFGSTVSRPVRFVLAVGFHANGASSEVEVIESSLDAVSIISAANTQGSRLYGFFNPSSEDPQTPIVTIAAGEVVVASDGEIEALAVSNRKYAYPTPLRVQQGSTARMRFAAGCAVATAASVCAAGAYLRADTIAINRDNIRLKSQTDALKAQTSDYVSKRPLALARARGYDGERIVDVARGLWRPFTNVRVVAEKNQPPVYTVSAHIVKNDGDDKARVQVDKDTVQRLLNIRTTPQIEGLQPGAFAVGDQFRNVTQEFFDERNKARLAD